MEPDSQSAVVIETGPEIGSLDVNKSGEAELFSDGQNELQGAVIIYDNELQEGQVVKLITNIKSENDVSDQNPDPDNVITLHASTNDSKDETIENIVTIPTQDTIKKEVLSNLEETSIPEDPSIPEDTSISENPSVPEIPSHTEILFKTEELSIPDNPDNPSIPEDPSIPEHPSISEDPSIPEDPSVLQDSSNPEKEDSDVDDDETIATFVTSTGQQLALYAVEDSEDIFAVALYDESGAPPTNFHFLMKSDVERLIGEGAVKTVKKPSANKQSKTVEKNDEEIKFERVSSQPIGPSIEKKEDILEKSIAAIKTELEDIFEPDLPEEVVVEVQKKESPAKIVPKPVAKNHDINNSNKVNPTKPMVSQTKSAVTQVRQIVTQTKPTAIQAKPIATPTRTVAVQQARPITQTKQVVRHVVTQPRQIVTQQRQIVAQPRQIVAQQRQIIAQKRPIIAQQRQIIAQPRQIVTQQRQIVSQPRQIITQQQRQVVTQPRKIVAQPRQIYPQTKQMILPTRQYVNTTKQYTNQSKRIVYQAKPQTQQSIGSAVTPLKKPIANQKEKVTYVFQNQDESYVIDLDSDAEILEQSTVQYILCDENASDTEMTFDELQASIQSFKSGKSAVTTTPKATTTTTTTTIELPKPKKDIITKFTPSVRSTPKPATILTPKKQPVTQIYRTYKSPKKARTTNNLLQAQRKIKQEVVDTSYGDFDDSHMSDDMSRSRQNSTLDSTSSVKAKRSRKQQLTVVNRGDSEIIIQPASAYSEEEDEPVVQRRRGRRKKKPTPDPDYNPRQQERKKGRRSSRMVEVIDIDVDESERGASQVMEITLDGKKGSSDKENDVISVDDTDEEDDAVVPRKKKVMRKPMMQCSHCMRNFRKRRALERHLQACPKSPAYLEKLEEKKKLGIDKKFKCKSCDEYFDIAVALARHVRVVHSPRKRGRPPKGWVRTDKSETDGTYESMGESSPEREVGPTKRRGRPPRKASVSKEFEKSPAPEGESKLETVGDAQTQRTTASEPKRRGRPPGRKSFYVEKSVTPEPEDKEVASSDEKKADVASPEPRRRGRPPKRSTSQDGESEDVEEKLDEKTEDMSMDSSTLPKKRGRPKKKSVSKDEETDIAEGEEKTESSAETVSSEPKKRGRPPKRTLSRDEEPLDDTGSIESEDKPEDDISKKQKLNEEEESDKKSDEPLKKRGRPPKEKLISIKEEKMVESSEAEADAEMETEEPRKRGRQSRASDIESLKKIKTEMEEMEEVVLSPSQTGKLKKLNCSECGKWFSSVAALNTHQLQHRTTKKSGIMVNRCSDCNTLVPHNAYAKHMSEQHGKTVLASTSTTKTSGLTMTTTPEQSPEKSAKIVQRSLRSSD